MMQSPFTNHMDTKIYQEFNAKNLRLIAADDTLANTRKQVKWDTTIFPKHGHPPINIAPLWCANVHFACLKMADFLTNWHPTNATHDESRVQIAIHKEIPEEHIIDFIKNHGTLSLWHSIGINAENTEEVKKLRNIFKKVKDASPHGLNKIVIDASNGHMNAMLKRIDTVRSIVGENAIILAGNVVTGTMAQKIIEAGADGVKVNHGPAKVCRTRHNAGTHRPTFSAALECAIAAEEIGGFIVPDGGGVSESGTAAIYFAAGAAGVMSGSLFAGHKECNQPFKINLNPLDTNEIDFLKKYMWYFGSASIDALDKYHGGKESHRPSEGTRRKVQYKESLKETLEQWFGGVASAVSFQSHELSGEKDSKTGEDIWRFSHLRNAKDRLVHTPY